MDKINLTDDELTFSVLSLKAGNTKCLVLFAASSGGNPERHLPLLEYLTEHECDVIAPYFDRLVSPSPSSSDLLLRARILKKTIDHFLDSTLPVVGIGHSIGATLLLAMAGGQMWMQAGESLNISRDTHFKRLVLFTPPTGFFQAPNALDGIQIPIQTWAGTLDSITPPSQVEFLRNHLPAQVSLDLRVIDGAGHFSFMNTLPPQINDPMVTREVFLNNLSAEVSRFVLA